MNVDRMETLLRYRAGELSREDAAAVERWPDFAALQAELDALDEAVLALPKEDPGTEALLARVRRPVAVAPRRPGVRALAIIGVALAAGAAFLVVGTTVADEQQAWVATALGDGLEVDGRPAPHATERLGRHGRLQSGRSGAQLVSRRGWVGLWPESTVSTSGGLALEKGTALLEGNGLTVRVGTSVVTIDGQAVVSAEPAEGEARVTAATTSLHPGADMKKDWLKLSSVALTAATVGGGLTVLVLDGGARVAVADEAPIAVAAGQVLTPAVSRTPRAVP
ncbi:MAG: hypothetical protein K1X89_30170, partial [Myxococcaceae bacterium]|nr:hypothetical protein [Myxococcaceae bacterium]